MDVTAVMAMGAAFAAVGHRPAVVLTTIAAHVLRVTATAMDAMVHATTETVLINLLLEVGTEEILTKALEAVRTRTITLIIVKVTTIAMVVGTTITTTARPVQVLLIAAHAQILAAVINKANYKAAFSKFKSRFFISTPPLNSPIHPLLRMTR